MTLLFKAVRSALETKDGKKMWYPRLVKFGKPVTTKELGAEISKRSSMAPGDTLNVVDTMFDVMQLFLLNGRSVRLGDIGILTVTASARGNGVELEEEVNAKQIEKLNIRFTPTYTRSNFNGTTRAIFEGVEFDKYDKSKQKLADNPGDDDDDDGIDPGV